MRLGTIVDPDGTNCACDARFGPSDRTASLATHGWLDCPPMAFRLRLFVKKRGTRRTGLRSTALVVEGLVCLALIVAGGYGLYWLTTSVLMAEEGHGWWPWFALIIPLALVGYGTTELVVLLWESLASSERRAAAVRKATNWEMPGESIGTLKPSLPAVPAIDAVVDSPGVRLAYRLPIDASTGWLSFTMAAVCLVWNTLVAIFVVEVVRQHLEGNPNWLLTWLMVPFVLAGVWTLVALARQVLVDIAMGTTRLEVSDHPFLPGETFRVLVSQTGRLQIRWLQVQLICEEQAVYQQGTDTRYETCLVSETVFYNQRKFEIKPPEAFEAEFDVTVPASGMHSFVSAHNAVRWCLVVRGRIARWGDFERRFPVYVYPAKASAPPQAPEQPALEGSTR